MNTEVKKMSNEELVKVYRESGNEDYLQTLLKQNEGILAIIATSYLDSIPNSELEDLMSEAYFPFLKAIKDFDESKGFAFTSFLKVYVKQHYNALYNEATRKKRYTGSKPDSWERLVEVGKDGAGISDRAFTIECNDFSSVEFMDLIQSLNLNDKEKMVVNVLMVGGTKGEVAKMLKVTPATTSWYIKRIREKFISAGYQYAI